jgi:hypothetical protein
MEHIKLFKFEIQRTHSLPIGKLVCMAKEDIKPQKAQKNLF